VIISTPSSYAVLKGAFPFSRLKGKQLL
jgi:hypothetical protein